MEWIEKQESLPDPRIRVLTFSPAYPANDPMRYRIMNGQFVKMCSDITHWTYMKEPEVTA